MSGNFKTTISKLSILVGALFIFHNYTYCQTDTALSNTNSASGDSIIFLSDETNFDSVPEKIYVMHNTRVAVISSTILPGLGQIYNRKFWKVPIIYGGGVGLFYLYNRNNFQYQRFKEAYNSPTTVTDPELMNMTSSTLQLNMDNFRRRRDFTIIGMGLLYIANIVDAMVDSYMIEYDISNDLSMKVAPTIIQQASCEAYASCGLKMSLRF